MSTSRKSKKRPFWKELGRIFNSGQARTMILTGSIQDLFPREDQGEIVDYVPLVDLLADKWSIPNLMLIVYELNGPIRFLNPDDRDRFKEAWLTWRTGLDATDLSIKKMLASSRVKSELDMMSRAFEDNLQKAVGNPTVAFELLRQMCLCSRTQINGEEIVKEDLIILIEAADMAIPAGDIHRMSDADRYRVSICQDWFSDPGFMNGHDSVVLLSESRSMLNQRIAQLPQVLDVEAPPPGRSERMDFIQWFKKTHTELGELAMWSTEERLAEFTAGLSLHALRQLLIEAYYRKEPLTQEQVVAKVEAFIKSQLGEEIVEFKKPEHHLDDLIGFSRLKGFIRKQLIPRFLSSGPDALPGAAVAGPIGSGKTFIFEAVSAELDMVVLVLKNIRSQWYGQTDVIFERLRRVLEALSKVMIFVDEADTQFGGVGQESHSTERRLTGKIQAMMSDPRLRGKVVWLLMTARIHLLSPDIRRPGRVGDLIIPVLDPEGEDREAFVQWMAEPVVAEPLDSGDLKKLMKRTEGYSAAGYASLRSEFKLHQKEAPLAIDRILEILEDYIPPAIEKTRRYQTLQALVNCTRRSLLPEGADPSSDRETWLKEIRELEQEGIR